MANLKDIVNVQIDIQSPAVNQQSFNSVLLINVEKRTGATDNIEVGVYTDYQSVVEAGFSETGTTAHSALIAFSQNPTIRKLYVCSIDPMSTIDVTAITKAFSAAMAYDNNFYGVASGNITSAEFVARLADLCEANRKLFVYSFSDISAEVATPLVDDTHAHSIGIYSADLTGNNQFIQVAYLAKILAYKSGSETWKFKQLSLILPSNVSSTDANTLEQNNLNWYTTYADKNITMNGKVRQGEWIDVTRFQDWLINEIQLQVFNVLFTNPKVPYTDSGIALIENAIVAVLKQGRDNGGIAEEEYDGDGNLISSFNVHVPLSADIAQSQKASRVLTDVTFTARLAGAIHAVEIYGTLTY